MCIRDRPGVVRAEFGVGHQGAVRVSHVIHPPFHCGHEAAPAPVSYTHLDVYKRQVYQATDYLGYGRALPFLHATNDALTAAGIAPVSYTHLRSVSAGVMFSDADLLGVPLRVIVSPRNLKNGVVELTADVYKRQL